MSTSWESEQDRRIIRYLLKDLPEDEAERIEEQYVCETVYFDRVAELEEELICSYMNQTLSPSDSSLFERKYLANPHLRQKIEVAKQLREEGREVASSWISRPAAESWWERLLHPQIRGPVFACLPFLIMVVAALVLQNARLRSDLLRLHNKPGLQRNQVPAASLAVSSQAVASLILLPGVTKSLAGDQDRRVALSTGLKEIRIQFDLPGLAGDASLALDVFRLESEGRRAILHRAGLHSFPTTSGRCLVWAAGPEELGPGNYLAFVKRSVENSDDVLESFAWTVVRP
ncbi:hypothetical protein [Paludibaculum fermentans]|uniref:hypothetical protein n=1 Tax=Paludibaculum fermentans TaxID=1473598 RepID=UPI003EBA2AB9